MLANIAPQNKTKSHALKVAFLNLLLFGCLAMAGNPSSGYDSGFRVVAGDQTIEPIHINPNDTADDSVDTTTDGGGNTYSTGTTSEPPPKNKLGVAGLDAVTGDGNIFLSKYDSTGSLVWRLEVWGSGDDSGSKVILDSSGNVLIAGYFTNQVTFDTTTLTSEGGTDVFLAKFDSSGNFLWVKQGGGLGNDLVSGISVDALGGPTITGTHSGSPEFGKSETPGSFSVRYDSDGDVISVDLD